jgi:hypothetical protein
VPLQLSSHSVPVPHLSLVNSTILGLSFMRKGSLPSHWSRIMDESRKERSSHGIGHVSEFISYIFAGSGEVCSLCPRKPIRTPRILDLHLIRPLHYTSRSIQLPKTPEQRSSDTPAVSINCCSAYPGERKDYLPFSSLSPTPTIIRPRFKSRLYQISSSIGHPGPEEEFADLCGGCGAGG